MIKSNYKPEDLALLVFTKLNKSKISYPTPPKEILTKLFECLFYASMKTEEGDLIKVVITLIDPNNPDPKPSRRIAADRWSYISFKNKIPLNVKALVKLSQAADPWSSSLAVYYDNNQLFIWGMIDQAVHYQSFLNYEANIRPEQPGLFQTSINGIGSLSVMFDYELLAKLNQNILVKNYVDVFKSGAVFNLIKEYSKPSKTLVYEKLKKEFPDERLEEYSLFIESAWIETVSRILLKIQNYGHGGAILITDNTIKDLNIKFKVDYKRVNISIINLAFLTISNWIYSNRLDTDFVEKNKEIPEEVYLDEAVSNFKKNQTSDELKGAIRYISSLSRVDGLVLLNSNLEVKGFGTIITAKSFPEKIYVAKSTRLTKRNLSELQVDHFGTRHRSMFSYCWNHEGSLGFVVSQDMDIRAITRIDDKLIMWENIKTQRLIKSLKLKRQLTKFMKP